MTTREHTTEHTSNLAAWALYLARMGWYLFPLRPGTKQPTGHREVDCPRTGRCAKAHQTPEMRATTDPDLITAAWSRTPFNIGLATGPSRLLVLDLDVSKDPSKPGSDGAAALAELAAARDATVPGTYTVATPSGGWHLYFTVPPGVTLRSTHDHLAPNIDTRAEGGYVVGPGSTLPAGGYELTDDSDPAELPAWLVQALSEPKPTTTASAPVTVATGDPGRYGAAALAGLCDDVRGAAAGQHNTTLSRAAYRAGRLLGAGLLDHPTARAALIDAGAALVTGRCGCTVREIARVTDAGLVAGARNPAPITTARKAA